MPEPCSTPCRGGAAIKLTLDNILLRRGAWSLAADCSFRDGVHLVSGDVGSGKSSLAAYLAGLLAAESGSMRMENIASSMVSFQFPEYHITGATLKEECRSWGLDPRAVLTSLGMDDREDTDPLQLSRGELKQLHLTCILHKHCDLLILDEPFSSLDCARKHRVCEAISRQRHGITIIFTHEQSVFPRIDRIWEISSGALLDRGPLPEAFSRWTGIPPLIQRLVADNRIPGNLSPDDIMEAGCRT